MLDPWKIKYVQESLFSWLQHSHDAAHELQASRQDEEHGDWRNDTSFVTDRYQFLVHTATSLWDRTEDLRIDPSSDPLLLKLPKVTIYPFRVAPDPHHPIPGITTLGRTLLSGEKPSPEHRNAHAFLSVHQALLDDRELLLLPWTGAEGAGCTGMWAGQGQWSGDRVEWTWLVCLTDEVGGIPDQAPPSSGGARAQRPSEPSR
ncbi:hypothetical protein [Umezawaea sp. Da 62-37]|uniref:hypothetical protein n=1 Tax=Umezawaea sp. Da 62-37 TaxID=3075927 RepID=UPI0028F6ECF4|nr:hypothetical protein [Umezawaea sp. Da 62-37]WNV82809.1 hypothetical protein RM788_32020 [Umezawaea sp. Da 62-37]